MRKPLEGVRVADFSHVMAGPYASHILTLLGADVIKVESPGVGDLMRNYGGRTDLYGMAPGFVAVNAGKRSIVLDLKSEDGKQVAREIVSRADVVLENFRPGVMSRFGLGYDEVRQFAPQVVYCSVSGYGQDGPQRDWPAIDNIVQATSGMMAVSGEKDDPPVRVGFPIVDTLTGQTAAMAIMAGLLRRGDSQEGEYIDVSMLDASLAFMTSILTPYLMTGQTMERMGNTGYSGQPTAAVYTTKDGRDVSLGIVQQNQFERFARMVAREDWLSDERFIDLQARRENFAAMQDELVEVIKTRNGADWERELSDIGVPCGLVREPHEALELDHLKTRSLRQPVEVNGLEGIDHSDILGCGFEMSKGSPGVSAPPPRLGEHGEEILRELGFGEAFITRMIAG